MVLIISLAVTVLGLVYVGPILFRRWRDASALRAPRTTGLPLPDEIRRGLARQKISAYHKLEYLPFVLDLVEPKAQAGILQEEAVLEAIHDRIVNSTNWLREASSVAILLALVVTFWNLNQALGSILQARPGTLSGKDLGPVLALVGANWPLIGAGLIFYVLSAVKQHFDWQYFYAWQYWLETRIFPELGASRSTANQLAAALLTFNETARRICTAILPLSGLQEALGDFQTGLVGELVPAMRQSLANVSVGLSDKALEGLQRATLESSRAVDKIQEGQARLLSIVAASEQRAAKLTSVVDAIAAHSSDISKALTLQGSTLVQNTTAVSLFNKQLGTLTDGWIEKTMALEGTVAWVNQSINSHNETTQTLARHVDAIETILRGLPETVSTLDASAGALGVAVTHVQAALDPIARPLEKTADSLGAFSEKAEGLQDRWQEAMLQMASLAEEVQTKTSTLDSASLQLSDGLVRATAQLGTVAEGVRAAGLDFERLSNVVENLRNGNQQIVKAFSDLQTLGQKLKSVGHSITGHFDIWQHETKDVFRSAQQSAASVGSVLGDIASLVTRLEASIQRLTLDATLGLHMDGHAKVVPKKLERPPRDDTAGPELAKGTTDESLTVNKELLFSSGTAAAEHSAAVSAEPDQNDNGQRVP